jgi:cytochrome c oxidase subunit 2
MFVVGILVLIVVGSVVFHLVSPWWLTPIASNWGNIDGMLIATFWITGAVFAAVILFMAYCVFRFRHKPGRKAQYYPENKKLELWLTGLTAVGVAAMLAPGLVVWKQYITVPEGAARVEVVGVQWGWSFRLPGEDGQLGAANVRWITDDNTLGISPNDPYGADDVVVEFDDLHLPVNQPVKMLLRSIDVLHDFYVPEFRAKMDMVPGMVTYFWFTPTRTGEFEALCAELCGTGHAFMRGFVIVEEQADYDIWLQEQELFKDIAQAGSVRVAQHP